MQLRMKQKKSLDKNVIKKILLMCFLFLFLVGNIIYVSLERTKIKEQMENTVEVTETQEKEYMISNLEEAALYMAGYESVLEDSLAEFYGEKIENKSAEIFYVVYSPENETDLWFFIKTSQEVLHIIYNPDLHEAECGLSLYTEGEIFSEIWNSDIPDIRDVSTEG